MSDGVGAAPTALSVGDVVPDLVRTISVVDMVAYAGATWDWHRMHYDQEFVAAKQFPALVVDGQLLGALLVEQVQDWLGPRCFVHRMSFRFRSLVFAGETVRCEGSVVEVHDGEVVLEQRVMAIAADGSQRLAVGPVRASVLVGRADGPAAASPAEAS